MTVTIVCQLAKHAGLRVVGIAGSDEKCEEDKLILVISIALLFLTTICIYLYLIFVRLPLWKSSIFWDLDDESIGSKSPASDYSEMKGNRLAKLKVI